MHSGRNHLNQKEEAGRLCHNRHSRLFRFYRRILGHFTLLLRIKTLKNPTYLKTVLGLSIIV